MENKLALCLLAGLFIGITLGVELVHIGGARACPANPCVDESQITPVFNRDYYAEAHRALQSSKNSIHMVLFELKYYDKYPNSTATLLVKDLIEAKNRGVEVKIIVDDFSTESNAFQILKDNGIEIKMDPENVTTHAKLIIIDKETVILGSTNLSFYGLEKNNEANVIIKDGETAEYYERYFRMLWG
jgi:phosphatidylserine/phosphatidylglycerophosphate/cardiolipin synthase-like enzyme